LGRFIKKYVIKRRMKKIYLILILFAIVLSFTLGYFVKALNSPKDNASENIINLSQINEIIEHNINLSYTQQIFENCSQRKNESEQLLCVNKFAIDNFNYVPREEVYSIDDMFDKGADCKSYSIYYATLAKMMGYEYAFFKTSNHIMTLVYFGRGYCIMDQKFAECISYKENLNNENSTIN
jgi:hypothetical protein